MHRLFVFQIIFVASVIAEMGFVVKEGLPHEFVGNTIENPDFPQNFRSNNRSGIRCSILRKGNSLSKYFAISESTGVITTRESLDREILCEQSDPCLIKLDVAISSNSTPVKIFPVSILVEDINDNTPQFPEPEVELTVPELTDVGTVFSISVATDQDVGENDVQTYEIIPENGPFGIGVTLNLDGTPEIGIIVRERLDREKIASYQMRVLAKDGGSRQRTGTVIVNIAVSDVNDHSPVFTTSIYNVTIRENLPLHTPVVHVKASDEDEGVNGQVKYSFSSRTLAKYPHIFKINSTSGEINLSQSLDYEKTKVYQLVVEVIDHGNLPKSSQTLVTVHVLDINDNEPIINFDFLSGEDHADITENADGEQFVAYISIKDIDSDDNSLTNCIIGSQEFRLETIRSNAFQVFSQAKFDREVQSQYSVMVTCQDIGKPPLGNKKEFIVNILDENDNAPKFIKDKYTVLVKEDLSIGESILHLNAIDIDLGVNGDITYELASGSLGQFLINPITGEISSSAQLDRETFPEVTLHVTARDNGARPMEATVTVVITIFDVNDEVPTFNQRMYHFIVKENISPGTFVGKVVAADPDLGLGGELVYSFIETTGTGRSFVISPENGDIRTAKAIDREEYPVVNLTVIAKDKGERPMSSTVVVSVEILNVNDNAPVFIFPSSEDDAVFMTGNQNKDLPIAKLRVKDLDQEDQSFFYSIESKSDKRLFRINSTSGEIFFNGNDVNSIGSNLELNVSATDNGIPPLTSTAILRVNINDNVMDYKDEKSTDTNHIIAIVVLSVTFVVSSIIIVVICVVRRQNNRKKVSRSDGEAAVGNKTTGSVPPLPPTTKKHVSFATKNAKETDSEDRQGCSTPNDSTSAQNIKHHIVEKLSPVEISCISVDEGLDDSLSEWSEETWDSGKGGSMEWKVDIPEVDHVPSVEYNGHLRGLYI